MKKTGSSNLAKKTWASTFDSKNLNSRKKHPKTIPFKWVHPDATDGKDFINVYSRGDTTLGRILSNFALTPFTYLGKTYNSVEGFWYTTTTGKDFSNLSGVLAKIKGRQAPHKFVHPTEKVLLQVYRSKLRDNPYISKWLLENELPFAHFYVMYGKRVSADKFLWTADLWRKLTDELKAKL